jgi:hypothetical protein
MEAMSRTLLIVGMVLALGGCARTYRVEHQSQAETTINSGGVSSSQHSETAARAWTGPWPVPPACLQP